MMKRTQGLIPFLLHISGRSLQVAAGLQLAGAGVAIVARSDQVSYLVLAITAVLAVGTGSAGVAVGMKRYPRWVILSAVLGPVLTSIVSGFSWWCVQTQRVLPGWPMLVVGFALLTTAWLFPLRGMFKRPRRTQGRTPPLPGSGRA